MRYAGHSKIRPSNHGGPQEHFLSPRPAWDVVNIGLRQEWSRLQVSWSKSTLPATVSYCQVPTPSSMPDIWRLNRWQQEGPWARWADTLRPELLPVTAGPWHVRVSPLFHSHRPFLPFWDQSRRACGCTLAWRSYSRETGPVKLCLITKHTEGLSLWKERESLARLLNPSPV